MSAPQATKNFEERTAGERKKALDRRRRRREEQKNGKNLSISAPQATKILLCERAAGEEWARRRRRKFLMSAPQATKTFNGCAAGDENFDV